MADHCWHGTGYVIDTYPETRPQVCCHCGAGREMSYDLKHDESHGPHAGRVESRTPTYYYRDERGEQPCVPVPKDA